MTRLELIKSAGYFEATISLELWRQAGMPNKIEKYETQAKKIVKIIMPIRRNTITKPKQ